MDVHFAKGPISNWRVCFQGYISDKGRLRRSLLREPPRMPHRALLLGGFRENRTVCQIDLTRTEPAGTFGMGHLSVVVGKHQYSPSDKSYGPIPEHALSSFHFKMSMHPWMLSDRNFFLRLPHHSSAGSCHLTFLTLLMRPSNRLTSVPTTLMDTRIPEASHLQPNFTCK
jgi:hypothetical protein